MRGGWQCNPIMDRERYDSAVMMRVGDYVTAVEFVERIGLWRIALSWS